MRARRIATAGLATLIIVASLTARAAAQTESLSDADVSRAISRGVEWLKKKRTPEGHFEPNKNKFERYWGGDTAMALLALQLAGEDPRTDEMSRGLQWLSEQNLKWTYTVSARLQAFSLVPGEKFRARMDEDMRWLLAAFQPRDAKAFGAYDYESFTETKSDSRYDNSNTQFAVLGMWMATEQGAESWELEPYWLMMQDHWTRTQNPDGGWPYERVGESTGSMTAAGLATLFVILDRAHAKTNFKKASPLLRSISLGMDWFGREFTADNPKGSSKWQYYYLYGVERVGRASGRKYFRERDWFRIGAAHVLREQQEDGAWPATGDEMTDLRNTALAMNFLCHGRAPLLLNKLEHGDDWNLKIRDGAGLARYAERAFERPLSWQIVNLAGPLRDLLEAPILYIHGSTTWKFSDVEIQKLREYCGRGGMILGVASDGSLEFVNSFRDMAQRAFPEFSLKPLPSTHPLFSGDVQFAIKDPPAIFEMNNGTRTLMLLCPTDIAASWNQFRVRGGERDFQLGANIYLYATDKTTIRSRLESAEIAVRSQKLDRTIRVARIKYNGSWDIEAHGWARMATVMANETGSRLLVSSGVTLDAIDTKEFRIAYMSGNAAFTFTPAELAGLRKFLTDGGTLIADAAGSSKEFTEAFEKQVAGALKSEPKTLPADSALLAANKIAGATDLTGIGYRRAGRPISAGRKYPQIKFFEIGKRAAVLYLPMDVSSGLLGTPVYECKGYDPESSVRIVRNLLLYAALNTAQKSELAREGAP
ncbi:MAG: DUF4159 domain-containing protein [Phycisphaerae bacterium]